MSSQPSAPSAPPPDGGAKGSRLHIRGIREMPAGQDEQLAIIFKEMRRATGVSREEIALRLATSPETIAELEKGSVLALPEWSELERIVSAYTGQLGLDARPVLRRLKAQIVVEEPLVVQQAPPAGPPAPPSPPASSNPPRPGTLPMPPSAAPPPQAGNAPARSSPQSPPPRAQSSPPPRSPPAAQTPRPQSQAAPGQPRPAGAQPRARAPAREGEEKKSEAGRLANSLRPILSWAILLGFVAALGAGVWYAAKRPRAVWSALDSLPAPIPRLMRSAWELVRPLEDIESRPQVSDPDHRKSDKLR